MGIDKRHFHACFFALSCTLGYILDSKPNSSLHGRVAVTATTFSFTNLRVLQRVWSYRNQTNGANTNHSHCMESGYVLSIEAIEGVEKQIIILTETRSGQRTVGSLYNRSHFFESKYKNRRWFLGKSGN